MPLEYWNAPRPIGLRHTFITPIWAKRETHPRLPTKYHSK